MRSPRERTSAEFRRTDPVPSDSDDTQFAWSANRPTTRRTGFPEVRLLSEEADPPVNMVFVLIDSSARASSTYVRAAESLLGPAYCIVQPRDDGSASALARRYASTTIHHKPGLESHTARRS